MTIIITTVEELKDIVSNGTVEVEQMAGEWSKREQTSCIVRGGLVDMYGVTIEGMYIRFKNCKIDSSCSGVFRDCNLVFEGCKLQPISIRDSRVSFEGCTVNGVLVDGGRVFLEEGNKFDDCNITPIVLQGSEEDVLALHAGGNRISNQCMVAPASATMGGFGTYSGNVHYFAESDMVIAGCWQGKLSEFKERAQSRDVPKMSYEAVYNYFRAVGAEYARNA